MFAVIFSLSLAFHFNISVESLISFIKLGLHENVGSAVVTFLN